MRDDMIRNTSRALIVIGCLLCWTCGGESGQSRSEPAANSTTAPPGSGAAAAAGSPTGAEPKTVADIFPMGPGRDLVLNNCASCHNVACSAIGQRTPERWDELKKTHLEHTPGIDLDTVFVYLKANFDSSKPEPRVPRQFLEGGCSPF